MERLEQVNLYSLEEAQGETRPESINTRSNRNQGRELFRRREDKEQCLKQRQEEFMLGFARKEDGIRHLAEMGCCCCVLPLPFGRLTKPFSLSPPQLGFVFQQPHLDSSLPAVSPGHLAPSRPSMP